MNEKSLVVLLVQQIELSWSDTLRGDTGRKTQQRFEIMRSPAKIGDLVLIGSVHPKTPPEDRLGWLKAVEDIPWPGMEGEEPTPTSRQWTIERLVGGEIKWTNVQVLRAVRESRMDVLEPIVKPDALSGDEHT